MDPTNLKQVGEVAKAGKATKAPKATNDPWITLPPSGARFRASLIGGIKNIGNSVYLTSVTGNLLTKVELDSEDDAVALITEINEKLDAIE